MIFLWSSYDSQTRKQRRVQFVAHLTDTAEDQYQLQDIRSLDLLSQSARHDRLYILQISVVQTAARRIDIPDKPWDLKRRLYCWSKDCSAVINEAFGTRKRY